MQLFSEKYPASGRDKMCTHEKRAVLSMELMSKFFLKQKQFWITIHKR